MRVLSGTYKGKKLICTTDQSIRPTTNRIKEYLFNILQDYCIDKHVADFFCGTGSLGIESLSRGASAVEFIESAEASIKILKQNLKELKIDQAKYQIFRTDALKFSRQKNKTFDLLFMDPPYKYPPLNELVHNVFFNNFIKKNGILVVEHEITNPIHNSSNLYKIFKQKKIGRSLISFIINNRSTDD